MHRRIDGESRKSRARKRAAMRARARARSAQFVSSADAFLTICLMDDGRSFTDASIGSLRNDPAHRCAHIPAGVYRRTAMHRYTGCTSGKRSAERCRKIGTRVRRNGHATSCFGATEEDSGSLRSIKLESSEEERSRISRHGEQINSSEFDVDEESKRRERGRGGRGEGAGCAICAIRNSRVQEFERIVSRLTVNSLDHTRYIRRSRAYGRAGDRVAFQLICFRDPQCARSGAKDN